MGCFRSEGSARSFSDEWDAGVEPSWDGFGWPTPLWRPPRQYGISDLAWRRSGPIQQPADGLGCTLVLDAG
jgi:hypothetical protein